MHGPAEVDGHVPSIIHRACRNQEVGLVTTATRLQRQPVLTFAERRLSESLKRRQVNDHSSTQPNPSNKRSSMPPYYTTRPLRSWDGGSSHLSVVSGTVATTKNCACALQHT
ncbi:hypothetical protein HYFRA_00010654 [Hymenoscyphus fraxineus]|uniref:Uncharacterized protein n=1 Tax=Hymenoscyphus fraxineus TaxID=746836 RepID=A0A9N9L4I4_9HELO|nr:hypothetical protein HYFRA_00010654 [Hymenoscyphus fraxineus]